MNSAELKEIIKNLMLLIARVQDTKKEYEEDSEWYDWMYNELLQLIACEKYFTTKYFHKVIKDYISELKQQNNDK